ncbi:MAG: glycosyltransferase family 39 protein [Vicinamibacterales bacterium]
MTAVALLARLPSIAEPLGIDQSLWASAVRAMARGQLLYRDVWEQRPPGIYFVYLTGFRLLGWQTATVAWLDVLAATVTTALLYAIAGRLGGRTAGAITAAIYAVFTMPAWLFRNDGFLERSVCETFFVVAVAAAGWCAVGLRERYSRLLSTAAGLSLGAAVVLKPNAGLYAPALLGWILVYGQRAPARPWRAHAAMIGWLIAGSLVVPVFTLVWLWHLGLLHDARVAVVDFNRYYVAGGFTPVEFAARFKDAVGLRLKTSPDPLWIGGAIGTLLVGWRILTRRAVGPLPALAIGWGAAAALVIAVNGIRLFNSYFIPAYAPLALLTGWVLTGGDLRSRWRRAVSIGTAVLIVAIAWRGHYLSKVIDPARAGVAALRGHVSTRDYLERFGSYANGRGYSATANAELATYVSAHTGPDDRIFLFGISGAGVYFLADRLPAQRFLRANFFVGTDFPDPAFRLEPVLAELAVRQPVYLIFERLHSSASSDMAAAVDALQEQPDVRRLLQGYQLETHLEDFTLYRRRDR